MNICLKRYVGDIDPVTKLRNGQGVYTFENPYFQYKGDYVNGQKQGKSFNMLFSTRFKGEGVLLMKDGSRYEGHFENGEMSGQGRRSYPDGTIYVGEFF